MLENVVIGFAISALLVGSIIFARHRRRMLMAHRRREHLLSLIGFSHTAPERTSLNWWARFQLRK
ncbi:MAG: hypothetical protein IV103_05915 [Zoogloea sp.]|nr:hypothetical protein [Zoogloea sp.]